MKATNKAGHEWTGETEIDAGARWYNYTDASGKVYQSKEVPAYRVKMDNAAVESGKRGIFPLSVK